MSKELEALKCVDVLKEDGCITTMYQGKALETIRQALTTKSKKEQAFDIIKEKEINITLVKLYETREEYVNSICRDYVVIRDNLPTEQEFNLLKEVL